MPWDGTRKRNGLVRFAGYGAPQEWMNKSGKIPLTSPLQRKYLSATSDDPLAVMKVTWPGSMYLSVSRDRVILCWESIREIHKPGQFYCGERENDILTVSARHSYDIVEQGRS